jgi:hypothetical protein
MTWPKEKQWQPGQSGNPRGVKQGSVRGNYRRRQMNAAEIDLIMSDPEIRSRVEEVLKRNVIYKRVPESAGPSPVRSANWTPRVVEEGEQEHCDPLDYLQRTIDNPQMSHRDKVFAASNLAPYLHPKRTGQFISNVISLPPPKDAADAKLQIGIVMQYARAGYCTLEESDKLVAHLQAFINAESVVELTPRIAALEAAALARGEQPATQVGIVIESGLPRLPGCENLIMPSQQQIESAVNERNDAEQSLEPTREGDQSAEAEDIDSRWPQR